jgi:hypothetical protein
VLRERAVADPAQDSRRKLHAHVGFGGELGVLIRPNGAKWRIGAGLYSSAKTPYGTNEQALQRAQAFVLPQYAVLPWRGNVGFAYQFGKRPLNPRFSYVEEQGRAPLRALAQRESAAEHAHLARLAALELSAATDALARIAEEERDYTEQRALFDAERDAIRKTAWRALRAGVRNKWDRRYLLLTSELSFVGRVDTGLGLEAFLTQTVQRSGERVSVMPRLAAESEIWPQRMKLRAGTYLEPTRFRETNARVHGTFGLDVRLLPWDVFRIWPEDYMWQLSSALDITRNYQAFSVGIGGWY